MGQIMNIQEESKEKFKDCIEWHASIDQKIAVDKREDNIMILENKGPAGQLKHFSKRSLFRSYIVNFDSSYP